MKKRFLALVTVCAVLFTCPVMAADLTKAQAEAALYGAESAIQSYKQTLDTRQIAANDAAFDTDRAERAFEEARKIATDYVRPEGMSKKDAENAKKALDRLEEKAEEHMEYCKKLQRKAEKEAKKAERDLDSAYRDLENAKDDLKRADD